MLVELKVRNFAIIDQLDVTFEPGLNILSGETGAGKSVILKSLALLMGEKALADTVRSGQHQAVIEGFFDLSQRPDVQEHLQDLGIDIDEGHMIVRRILSAQGKSRIYLNGSLSPLTTLKEIVAPLITVTGQAAPLIEMTGQHDNRHLQSKSYHLDLLDRYTGSWQLREKVSQLFQRRQAIHKEIEILREAGQGQAQRIDFLRYQEQEISSLNLKPGEEEELSQKLSRLKNSTKLVQFASQVEQALYSDDDSVLVRLHRIVQDSSELKALDASILDKIENLHQAKTLIEDSVYEIRNYLKDLEVDPSELDEIEERFSSLRKLQKKYGPKVEDILAAFSEIQKELDDIENSDEKTQILEKELRSIESELKSLCEDLHTRRTNGALLLAKGVNEELVDLNMKGVEFVIKAEWLPTPTNHGQTEVEFMIRPSKKDETKPLAKYASGGELSRILLALKQVVGNSDQPHTYLFDEVDTGVSGPTAEKVGRKLKSIAQGQQVICVTHLPQVASFADVHFLIEKAPSNKGVQLSIHRLDKETRVQEIARLISGEKITPTSLAHAKSLLKDSRTL
ncbi:MAG: DNA repair protein RecN [Bdellovibrionales bacterium]|nr:DNA repair protein RecN [Bdellovibrionales bacterium]